MHEAGCRGLRPPPARPTARLIPVVGFLLCVLVSPLTGQQRLRHSFDGRDGLDAPPVFDLAQDSTGFLWIGTVGGLYRFDGTEIRRWAGDSIRGRVRRIAVTPRNGLVALEQVGRLWTVGAGGARRLEPPSGDGVADAAVTDSGALWTLSSSGALWRRGPDGSWRRLRPELEGERPRRLFAGPAGGVDLATDRGLWSVSPDGGTRRLAALPRIVDVLLLPDGRRCLLTFWRKAFLLEGGRLRRIANVPGRGIDVERRGRALWISFDRYLARFAPGRPLEVLGRRQGVEAGGPLLVDREGSLWMGTFTSLLQFPEPSTRRWDERDGLPSAHARFVARAGDTLWVATWQGLGLLRRVGGVWSADTARGPLTRSEVAVDAEGDVWEGTENGLLERRPGVGARLRDPNVHSLGAVAGGGETLWLGVEGAVYRVHSEGLAPDGVPRVDRIPAPDASRGTKVTALTVDGDGRLWAGIGERICRTAGREKWRCWTVPGAGHFSALLEVEPGRVWAASPRAGVLRLREGRWEPLAGLKGLASRSVLNLVPSPSGGVWVLGHGLLLRVRPAPEDPDGWEVLERLGPWHGLPATGGSDLEEGPDGTLWITTARGIVRVPARVRRRTPEPPTVALVEARVDDERLPLGGSPELTHDRNRLELRFAALSYRAPSAVRYQVRLLPDTRWSDARSQPVVRWVDLRAGEYRAEVRASLDGEHWSEPGAAFAFSVLPPWYLEPGWLGLFGFLLVLLLLVAYRTRVAHLVELERQRTRIAMDLHDEMGAALGSIGIQAGILARPETGEAQRRRLADEIAETAGSLGSTLADIVWSLDPRAGSLPELAQRLEKRGRRLFAGGGAELRVSRPEGWPEDRLPASVRRNVLLIGLEALANAAAHAEARTVRLALGPAGGGRWRLSVRDDGRGIGEAGSEEGDGMGLLSMRRRAREIGAEIAWRRSPRGGTEVRLLFPLGGPRPLAERIRARWTRLRDRMNVLLRRR